MNHIHKKARRAKKRKINWITVEILLIATISIITIMVIINKKKNSEEVLSEVDNNDTEIANEIEETKIIEPEEDENIKELINEIMEENGLTENNFAFFYYNQDTKKYYFYNENKYFTAASTVKVPVAMLYYDKINNGELTLDTTLKYTSDCYEAGGGTTASTYKEGDSIPIKFLLEQAIVNSDNTAVNILIKNLGWNQYRKDITNASYGCDLLKYLYNNIDSYSELIENMKKSSGGQYLKKYIDKYDVAHKYGSYNGYIHDYGIVFGETTYLIGVYTKSITNADELIANISKEVLESINSNIENNEIS